MRNSTFLVALFFLAIILKLVSKQTQYPSLIFYSLTYEQAFLNSNPKDLALFLNEKRFNEYLNTEKIIWQVRSWNFRRIKSKNFIYDASLYLFTRCISWKSVLVSLHNLSKLSNQFSGFTQASLKDFYFKFFEDFVWRTVNLDLKSKIQLVTTQSHFTNPPVCFSEEYAEKTFRIMIWYSINSQGISRDFTSPEGIPFDGVTNKIDLQLVWTDTHSALLSHKSIGRVAVIGSCLFQVKADTHVPKKRTSELNVLFFDVMPFRDDLSAKSIEEFNLQDSLYDYNFCSRILLDSITTLDTFTRSRGISFKMTLKPKRRITPHHIRSNKSYENLLLNLKKQDLRFSISQPHVNLYTVVGNSDLVLGPPYTSPVFVASELNVPSCYLAFETTGWRIHKSLDNIRVYSSKTEFLEFLEKTF